MSVTIGYSSSASAKIPYRVAYRCCFCQGENVDTEQGCTVRKSVTRSDPLTAMQKGHSALLEKLQLKLQEMQEAINQRDYLKLNLRCRCSSCKKKQPWSSYWPAGGAFTAIARMFTAFDKGISSSSLKALIGFFLFLGIGVLLTMAYTCTAVGIALLCLLALPSIVAGVHNAILQGKVDKLPPEFHPQIQIDMSRRI